MIKITKSPRGKRGTNVNLKLSLCENLDMYFLSFDFEIN